MFLAGYLSVLFNGLTSSNTISSRSFTFHILILDMEEQVDTNVPLVVDQSKLLTWDKWDEYRWVRLQGWSLMYIFMIIRL